MVKWTLLMGLISLVVLELWALLGLGGLLGLGWTLAWVGVSCAIGILTVRWAGVRTLIRIHQKLREEVLPTTELMDMGFILMEGFLLVLPGFISDGFGLLFLLPPVRWGMRGLLCLVYGHMLPPLHAPGEFKQPEGTVVEIKAEDIT